MMTGEDKAMEVLDGGTRCETRLTLVEALNLWVELTGVEPCNGDGNRSFKLGDFSIQRLHDEIQEALDLDSTEITGRMMLSYIAQAYFEDRRFTLDEMLNDSPRIKQYLVKAGQLASFLRGPDVAGLSDEFVERLKSALDRYDALSEEVREVVEHRGSHGDRGLLAVLRRDAMRTLAKLEVHQFLDGEPEAPGTVPTYGRFIYQWDNINSMLNAMVSAPSGVTVNMIIKPDNPYGVYFAFAIRNGGRLFVFTDKDATPHPLAESMWRRPDKALAARANRNWFPYDLAGLRFNSDGKAYIETSRGKSLVMYQANALPVRPLSELAPPQVIWLTMMLDLIVEKFWRQEYRAKQLSFTGEMLKVTTPLLEAAKASNLPVALSNDSVLTVAPITLADVHSDAVREEEVGAQPDDRHRWLEERYRDQVSESCLEILSESREQLYLSHDAAPGGGAVVVRESEVITDKNWSRREDVLAAMPKLDVLDPTSFGTKEELERNRKFIARANYASQIDRLAAKEFERRKQEVLEWVHARIKANRATLEWLVAQPEVFVKTEYRGEAHAETAYGCRYDAARGTRVFVHRLDAESDELKENRSYYFNYAHGRLVLNQTPYKAGMPACYFSGAPAKWLVQIIPETVEQLAFLCGVQVSELPDVLQHWTMLRLSGGNELLRRIDPLIWAVSDPWCSLRFAVSVFVGRRAMTGLEGDAKKRAMPLPAFVVA